MNRYVFCPGNREKAISHRTILIAWLLAVTLAAPSSGQEIACDTPADRESQCELREALLNDLNEGYRHTCEIQSSVQVIVEGAGNQDGDNHTVYMCACTAMEIMSGGGDAEDDGPVFRPGPIGPTGRPRTPGGLPNPTPTYVECLEAARQKRTECQVSLYRGDRDAITGVPIPGADESGLLAGFQLCLDQEAEEALVCRQQESRRRRAEKENSAN